MRLKFLPAIAVLAAAAGLASATPAAAAPYSAYIHNLYSPRFALDADANAYGRDGQKVQLWDSSSYSRNFRVYDDGTIRRGEFCLDADLNTIRSNGTRVQMWRCNGSLQQKWTITESVYRTPRGSGALIINRYSGRCLDADLNTIGRNGTVVQLWDCNRQSQQLWQIKS